MYLLVLRELYYYLLSMADDELWAFDINGRIDRATLFREMRLRFDSCGPITRFAMVEVLEQLLVSGDWEKYWDYIVVCEVPLDEVVDKEVFANDMFFALTDRRPIVVVNEVVYSNDVPPWSRRE